MNAPNIEKAVAIYYNHTEIGNKEIKELFNCGATTACRLKKIAKDKMAELKTRCWDSNNVDIETAFIAWGLDIHKLEEKLKKLNQLKGKGLL